LLGVPNDVGERLGLVGVHPQGPGLLMRKRRVKNEGNTYALGFAHLPRGGGTGRSRTEQRGNVGRPRNNTLSLRFTIRKESGPMRLGNTREGDGNGHGADR
jgi:hypothetical protein